MTRLSWLLPPDAFVLELSRLKKTWRRNLAGALPQARRRRLVDLTRDRMRAYKHRTGLKALPRFPSFDAAARRPRRDLNVRDLKIVLMPASAAWPQRAGRSVAVETSRKRLRRTLHAMTARAPGDPIELLASRRTGTRGVSVIGDTFVAGRRVSRGLFLEALGAAILPNLTDQQTAALEEAGAIVLENGFVCVDKPLRTAVSNGEPPADPWHLRDIKIQQARAKGLTGKDVVIGIMDTGIDGDHPEFRGKAIYYQAFHATGEMSTSRRKTHDYGDHGTHVSGLCAGKTVGVAPDAGLAVAAVLTEPQTDGSMRGTVSQVLAGMNWLADGGRGLPGPVDVINVSLGLLHHDPKFFEVVEGNRLTGTLLIASIGNAGCAGFNSHTAPGSFDGVIAIGAADDKGHVADFSSWGATFSHPYGCSTFKPDLLAPGVDVISCVPKGKYEAKDGTSMAAPLASGVAALLMQKKPSLRRNPDALAAELLGQVRPTVPQPNGTDPRRIGVGSLDLATI